MRTNALKAKLRAGEHVVGVLLTIQGLGYDVKAAKFPFSASGKARILGEEEGFVKVVSETKYDELLGVHIVGPHATEIIHEAIVALHPESTADELGRVIHAHPTVSEAVMEAAEGIHGLTIHF